MLILRTCPAALAVLLLLGPAVPTAHAQAGGAEGQPEWPSEVIIDARTRAAENVGVEIQGYARVAPERMTLSVAPEAAPSEVVLSYATNRAVGQRLVVTVSGLPADGSLVIEPVEGGLTVEQVAKAGSPGVSEPLTISAPGTYVLLEGVGQVVAQRVFRVTPSSSIDAAEELELEFALIAP
jgi:hypothetical protein